MKKKITQLRWLAATIMLVAAMVMPSVAWADDVVTYTNGFGSDGSYEEATLTTDKYDIDGDGTKDKVYEIGNAGQLYWFADKVNNDNTNFGSANAVLTASITVNSSLIENLDADGIVKDVYVVRSWTPIGGYYKSNYVVYSGTFDGNGKSIRGLYYNFTSKEDFVYAGLFGRNSGTIKNVVVEDSYFGLDFNSQDYYWIGCVCGANTGTIENCVNKATVTAKGTSSTKGYVGGVCGNNTMNSSNNSNTGKISNCKNAGNVTENVSGISYVGGVSGCNNTSGVIENSSNTGTVSGTYYVGGVCGCNGNSSSSSVIENCYNMGAVSGGYAVGGVCGLGNGNSSNISVIENCYNIGTVSGTTAVGGVIGYIEKIEAVHVTNCHYLEGCNAEGTTFNCTEGTSKTADEFGNGSVCYLLNGEKSKVTDENPLVWYQNIDNGAKDNYPLLDSSHGTVYAGYRHSETTPYCSNSKSNIPSDYGHLHAYNSDAIDETNGNHDKTYQGVFNWTDNDDKTAATVTATFTCAVCGKVETPDMTAVHDDDKDNVAATCTEKGYNYYKTSKSFPGETFTAVYRQEVPALNHDYSGTASINTTKQIYEKYCKRCSEFLGYYATSDGKVVANENPEGVFTADELTLKDATTYDNKAVFTATKFTYNRTFTTTEWTTWYVPFDLTLTDAICAKYDFSRINNVHQYDTNNDGTADKTVVESFRQTAGVTLKANYPYLVKPVSEGDVNMVLNLEGVQPALAQTNSIDCQSVDFSYTFTGTYTAMGEGGSGYYDPYTLWTDGTWQHFHSLDPMRHYLTVTQRNSSYASVVPLRSIMLSVIGDEGTTGIVNMYSDERKAAETYDLGGRRLPAGASQKGVMIDNGKVIIKK